MSGDLETIQYQDIVRNLSPELRERVESGEVTDEECRVSALLFAARDAWKRACDANVPTEIFHNQV